MKVLHHKFTGLQEIVLLTEDDGSLSLYIDGYHQFNSNFEKVYHTCLYSLPALYPKKLKKVLVLGGGDGLGPRNLLHFPSIKRIDLVDFDEGIIDLAKSHPDMIKITENSMNNKKVKIYAEDAKKYISQFNLFTKYDLIITDFPDPTSAELWTLFSKPFFKKLKTWLSKDGVLAIQASDKGVKSKKILKNVGESFSHVHGYECDKSIECFFIMAMDKKSGKQREIPIQEKGVINKKRGAM
jgi:spermidine synthase